MKNYLKLIVSEKALEAFKPEEKIMLNLVLNVGFDGLTNDYCPNENTKETIELVNSVLANFRKLTDEDTLTVSAETGLPLETLEAIKRHMEATKRLKEEEYSCVDDEHPLTHLGVFSPRKNKEEYQMQKDQILGWDPLNDPSLPEDLKNTG